MADKIPWCKFWTSCLTDPDLEELELHQWARWARLVIFIRAHGIAGKMTLTSPAIALQRALRVPSFEALLRVIKLFKNVTLTPCSRDIDPPVRASSQEPSHRPSHRQSHEYFMYVKNWFKYQGDLSKERTRKWRRKNTVTKTVTSDALDKSRVDLTSTSTSFARDASLGASPRSRPLGSFEEFQQSIPESERMTPEEMKAMRLKNLGERPFK